MAETQEERLKRLQAARAAARAAAGRDKPRTQKTPEELEAEAKRRRWIILRQRFSTKYYEITQNAKNWVFKFFYKQYWTNVWLEIQWTVQELNKNLLYSAKEIANLPSHVRLGLKSVGLFARKSLVNLIGCPHCESLDYMTKLNSKELLHYHQTLLNDEWLGNALQLRNEVEVREAAKKIIKRANFDVTDRNKSLYDLLLAVHKERELRRIKTLGIVEETTGMPIVPDAKMEEAEHGVEENLKEWRNFLKGFNND